MSTLEIAEAGHRFLVQHRMGARASKLLLGTGMVDANAKDSEGQTSLSLPTEHASSSDGAAARVG